MSTIYHLATVADWEAGQHRGSYLAESLATEGFIHCSTASQLASTANAIFRGRTDLLLLTLDDSRLSAEVRCEAPVSVAHEDDGELFPHLYGALNLDSVVAAERIAAGPEGEFTFAVLG
jgi:uncharacterized protein (DUF952 family)